MRGRLGIGIANIPWVRKQNYSRVGFPHFCSYFLQRISLTVWKISFTVYSSLNLAFPTQVYKISAAPYETFSGARAVGLAKTRNQDTQYEGRSTKDLFALSTIIARLHLL